MLSQSAGSGHCGDGAICKIYYATGVKYYATEALSLPSLVPLAEKEVSEASFCSDEGSSLSSNEFASSWTPGSSGSTSSGSTVITENTKARRRRLVEGPPDSNVAKDVSCS